MSKRPDGFHNLETIFYPVPWFDALEAITLQQVGHTQSTRLTVTGIPVQGDPEQNICYKAWQLLQKDFPQLPAVEIHLHKTIPAGAGLGGGSADGAYMLQLLNQKFQLQLSTDKLAEYALRLGSDCPIFILNKPCFATGRGEVLEPVSLNLDTYSITIVNPGIHINTGWAFSKILPKAATSDLRQTVTQPVENWKDLLVNDFEVPVMDAYPAIASIKQMLYQNKAIYASLSGSGSSVFGIFPKKHRPALDLPAGYLQHFIP